MINLYEPPEKAKPKHPNNRSKNKSVQHSANKSGV